MSVAKGLFVRLTAPVPDITQLKIIIKNLSSFHQSQLGLVQILHLPELVKVGRQLEARRASIEAYVPPPSRSRTLALDLACLSTDRPSEFSSSRNTPRPSTCTTNTREVPSRPQPKCWNWQQPGHRSAQCPAPLKNHC